MNSEATSVTKSLIELMVRHAEITGNLEKLHEHIQVFFDNGYKSVEKKVVTVETD